MRNRKGLNAFTSFIIAMIIIIPVVLVILIVFIYGSHSIQSLVSSPEAYVSQTMVALNTGESVVVGTLSPSVDGTSGQFMAQFYGSPKCISLLDQLSRSGQLSTPNDPTTMAGKFFVCTGAINAGGMIPTGSWNALPIAADTASFPSWFPAVNYLNAVNSGNTSGINGSHSTLSYYVNINPQTALGDACVSFLNASTSYGPDTPGAYVTTLNCAPESVSSGVPVFMSVKTQQCQGSSQYSCGANPWAFLFGNPGQITLQTCSYVSGAALICSFGIN